MPPSPDSDRRPAAVSHAGHGVRAQPPSPAPPLPPASSLLAFSAFLFDLDGVLTTTARIHARCWKQVFDELLRTRAGGAFVPFTAAEYQRFVDGKPRFDGVRAFLASRGLRLPEQSPAGSNADSVASVAEHKDALVAQGIAAGEAQAYPGSVAFVRWLRAAGRRAAVVSSSHHAPLVLAKTGLDGYFDAVVSGADMDREHIAGKPAPDIYLYAARRLGASPRSAAVGGNVKDGCHIASLGGSWMAAVYGIAGMREGRDGRLAFAPRPYVDRLRFTLLVRGQRLQVALDRGSVAYRLAGAGLTITHGGEEIALHDGQPVTRQISAPAPPVAAPEPIGPAAAPRRPLARRRAPRARRPEGETR